MAGLLVEAVRDGKHRAVLAGAAQCLHDLLLGAGVEVGCDLVEKQQLWVGCHGARDGEQLRLSLGEKALGIGRVVALGQGLKRGPDACELRR